MKNKCNFTNLELLDCPFCGSEFHPVTTIHYYHRQLGRQYFVECRGCGATSTHADIVEVVIDAWNRRVKDE